MPPPKVVQQYRHTAVDSVLGKDSLLLRKMKGKEELGRLFSYEMTLHCQDVDTDLDRIVGTNLTVRLLLDDKNTRYFNGFVAESNFIGVEREQSVFRARVVPWLWFLSCTQDCRIFQEQTVEAMMKDVFKAHGFTDFEFRLSGQHKPWVYCVQYNETDFNFVSRLMEKEGIYYFFEHTNGKHMAVFTDHGQAHKPAPGYETIKYHAQSGLTEEDYLYDFTMEKKVRSGSVVMNDYDFEKPSTVLVNKVEDKKKHQGAHYQMYEYPGAFKEMDEGKNLAQLRLQEFQSDQEIIHAKTIARGPGSGHLFTMKDYPRRDQNREYLIVKNDFTITSDPMQTGTSEGKDEEIYLSTMTAIPSGVPYRAARVTKKPMIQGPQTAIVSGPAGEEIHTDKYGRVKVHFPWDRYSKANETSSCWIRVSQPSAGKGYGYMSIPRIGQEVLVEYMEGDPDRPIITGRVYNQENMPPYPLPGDKTRSTSKTNSTPDGNGYNEFRLEDKKGKEQIYLHAEKDMDTRVKDCNKTWIGGDNHLHIEKNTALHVVKNTDVLVEGDFVFRLDGDLNMTVKSDHVQKTDGNSSVEVVGDSRETTGGNYQHEVNGDVFIKSKTGKIVIEAMTNITLKVGQSTIAIDNTGIGIKAPMMKLEASATMDINGGGMMTQKAGMIMIN